MLAIRVVLAHSDKQQQWEFTMPEGSTARQAAVQALGDEFSDTPIGVFGEQVKDDYQLLDGDRVEILRPLLQSPMEWRRQRALAQKPKRKPKP